MPVIQNLQSGAIQAQRRLLLKGLGVAAVSAAFPDAPAQSAEAPSHPAEGTPLAARLADYAAGLRYENLPADVVRLAKRALLDTVGCAFAGYSAEPSVIARRLAAEVSARHPATVLFAGTRTSPDLAVFANGVAIRYLDFNDAFVSRTGGAGHPSDMIAALLAAGELGGCSGRDLVAAIVLSYEVFCKIADVFDYLGNGIDHSVMTGMGAVVGAGTMMRLTREQLMDAIGITVGGNTATRQGRADALSNWKAYAAADACRKAMFAVQLAQQGMTGPRDVFEGRYGFFPVMGRHPVEPVQLGEPFGIRRVFTKRFPVGQFAQTVAQAALELRPLLHGTDDVAEITIRVSRSAIRIMADGPDKWHPDSHETADHSIPYAAGVVLMFGRIDPEFYEDPYLHDPRLLALVGRIRVVPSDEADRLEGEFNLCELEVVSASGERKAARVEYHRGHFRNPMTDEELEEKFRQQAARHMPSPKVETLLALLRRVDQLPNLHALIEATRL